jgi:hypothetical protein
MEDKEIKSSFFWDVTQRLSGVSGQPIGLIFKGQAVKNRTS